MIIPQARIWLTMSHDGLLPKVFGAVHPTYRTPHISTLITGVAASLAAGLIPLGVLGELVSIGTLIAFIVVCIGVLVLRYTRPDLPRPFRIKGVWAVSLLGVLFCSGMAYSLPTKPGGGCWSGARSGYSCTWSTATGTANCGPQRAGIRREARRA